LSPKRSGNRAAAPPFLRRRVRKSGAIQRLARIAVVAAAGIAVYALVLGESGWIRIAAERAAVEELEREIDELQDRQDAMKGRMELLQQPGSLELERAARDQYGLVRDDERVLYVVEGDAAP
jgi:cell division protein FtsB